MSGQGAALQPEEQAYLPIKVFTPRSLSGRWVPMLAEPGKLLLCPDRGAHLPLSSLHPGLRQLTREPRRPAHPRLPHAPLSEPRHARWQHAAFSFTSPFWQLFASSSSSSCLLLPRNDAGRKALLSQKSSKRPWWLCCLTPGKSLGDSLLQKVVKDASQQQCKISS